MSEYSFKLSLYVSLKHRRLGWVNDYDLKPRPEFNASCIFMYAVFIGSNHFISTWFKTDKCCCSCYTHWIHDLSQPESNITTRAWYLAMKIHVGLLSWRYFNEINFQDHSYALVIKSYLWQNVDSRINNLKNAWRISMKELLHKHSNNKESAN